LALRSMVLAGFDRLIVAAFIEDAFSAIVIFPMFFFTKNFKMLEKFFSF
jgi:hypothetical protein